MIQFLTENWLALTIAASPFVLLEIVRAHRRRSLWPRLHDVQDQEARDQDAELFRPVAPARVIHNSNHNGVSTDG